MPPTAPTRSPAFPCPVLILRDEADGVVLPFEPYMLLSAARAEGSLVPSIKYEGVPNHRPPSREGHLFTDNTEALIMRRFNPRPCARGDFLGPRRSVGTGVSIHAPAREATTFQSPSH